MKQNKSFLDKLSRAENEPAPAGYAEEEQRSVAVEDRGGNDFNDEETGGALLEEEGMEDGQLAIDVYQDDDFVIIKSIVGGVRPEDLDIDVTSDMVTIKGSREKNETVSDENYYYQECFWGSFSRSVILPCDIQKEKVEATMKNGILTVKLPKVEKNMATRIEVRGE